MKPETKAKLRQKIKEINDASEPYADSVFQKLVDSPWTARLTIGGLFLAFIAVVAYLVK